jgi:hypothetical protein
MLVPRYLWQVHETHTGPSDATIHRGVVLPFTDFQWHASQTKNFEYVSELEASSNLRLSRSLVLAPLQYRRQTIPNAPLTRTSDLAIGFRLPQVIGTGLTARERGLVRGALTQDIAVL